MVRFAISFQLPLTMPAPSIPFQQILIKEMVMMSRVMCSYILPKIIRPTPMDFKGGQGLMAIRLSFMKPYTR